MVGSSLMLDMVRDDLARAVWLGQINAVRCLSGSGVNANEVACWYLNTSMLMLACLRRQAEVAALLIDSDAEIDFLDRLARR